MTLVDNERIAAIVEAMESKGWGESAEARREREHERDRLLASASVVEVLWVIQRLALTESKRAQIPALMGRLPQTIAVSATEDTAHQLADVIEAIVAQAPTTLSAKGHGAIQVAFRLFERLSETPEDFKARLAHTVLQIATTHHMRFIWTVEPFSPWLREADQDLSDSLVWELSRLKEDEFGWAQPDRTLPAILSVTPPEAWGAAQLSAISQGKFKTLERLRALSSASAPWPVREVAQSLGDTDRQAFLAGLATAVDTPTFADRDALKALLRTVRPLVAALEPRFRAEDREQDLTQRPVQPGRPRYRS